jgi:carboxyl-terminal processing protease
MNLNKNSRKYSLSFLAGILAILYFASSLVPDSHKVAEAGFFSSDLEVFEEIIDLVSDKYVYPPNHKKLFSAAIEGMIKNIDSELFTLSKNLDINTIKYKKKGTQYKLTYDRGHNWDELERVYYFLHNQPGKTITKNNLENSAIEGVMSSLDTYSQYMNKDSFKRSMRDTEGKYGGLGMVITMKDNRLYVVKTMKNSPAQRAGIQADDAFVSVNGNKITGMHIEELADLLRGYPETRVKLTLLRPIEARKRTYNLTREIILINTVEYKTLDNQIGYLKINSFSKQTEKQLKVGLNEAKKNGVKGFIIDLRGNPGGLLTQSVKVASHFLFKGRMVVYTQGRETHDYEEYRGLYKDSLHQMPVAIIVNEYSASASEIVAGALRDSGKALIIGENSYGKGSVQTIFRLSDGSGLRLTTSKYYTPSGVDITKHGIVPEIQIINDIVSQADHKIVKTPFSSNAHDKNSSMQPSLNLKVSSLNKFFQNQGITLSPEHDSTIELALRILKNTTVASKKRSMDKAREIATNINY